MDEPGSTMLIVPLVSVDRPLAAQERWAVQAGATCVELRVDLIDDLPAVEAYLGGQRSCPAILTIRSAEEGGAWDGSDAERIALIERLGLLRPGYVDVELSSWERSANLRQKIGLVCRREDQPQHEDERPKNELIISSHDFAGTPSDLTGWIGRLEATPAAIIKAVCRADDAVDAVRVLQLWRKVRRRAILLAMGESGLATRVLAGKFGAAGTFATLNPEDSSAPGQPTLVELQHQYRWSAIRSDSRVFGVVGWPVGHSHGPLIHNAAMGTAGVSGVYLPWAVRGGYERFAAFMELIAGDTSLGIEGLSVTIPHKAHALRWLRSCGGSTSGRAARCGAVNTLTQMADGNWAGDNTDIVGIEEALLAPGRLSVDELRSRRVAILGAGGAARAALAALADRAKSVTVYNRTAVRSAALAEEFGCLSDAWDDRPGGADVIINCTSVGMMPAVEATPLPGDRMRADQLVFDTIYNPSPTRLLREAAQVGAMVIPGIDMFVAQAVAQFKEWKLGESPEGVMRRVLEDAIRP